MMIHHLVRAKGPDVRTIQPDATVQQAAQEMASARIGALVVATDAAGPILGVLSERDVVRGLAEHGASVLGLPVSALMTAEVHTCQPSDTVNTVMVVMTERRIRHLPVVEGGAMVGIVSIGDVVKHRMSELEDERAALADYITTGR
jgi:signal-transduction protein with cAMP-binding, CBS, and nucleotidyltransferase domain